MPIDPRLIPTPQDPTSRLQARLADQEKRIATLERSLGTTVATVNVGPITGDNGITSGSWATLPGLSFTYQTPSASNVLAEIKTQVRIEHIAAAWSYAETGLLITPAPVSKAHANATVGGFNGILTLHWGHNAGVQSVHHVGWDNAVLLPDTLYTFQAMALGNAGQTRWINIAENWISGTFTAQRF